MTDVVRKNEIKNCRGCGQPTVTAVPGPEPLCVDCLDGELSTVSSLILGFYLILEDGAWEEGGFEVPIMFDSNHTSDSEIEYWWQEHYGAWPSYRKVIAVKVSGPAQDEGDVEHATKADPEWLLDT